MQKNKKFYTPTNDVIFSNLFGKNKNKRFTKQFLEHLLEMEIKTIDVDKNTLLKKEFNDTKESILDIKCLLNDDTQCNIEMQLADEGNIEKRILYYWSRMYSNQLENGNDYNTLKKTIAIVLIDFELDKVKNLDEYITGWQIIEKKHRKEIYSDDLEIYIIEIPKFRRQNNIDLKDILTQWLVFIDYKNEGAIKMAKRSNKEIDEAAEELMRLNADKEVRRRAELYELIEINARSARNYMLKKGYEEGMQKRYGKGHGKRYRKRYRKTKNRNCKKIKRQKTTLRNNYRNNRINKRRNRKIIKKRA